MRIDLANLSFSCPVCCLERKGGSYPVPNFFGSMLNSNWEYWMDYVSRYVQIVSCESGSEICARNKFIASIGYSCQDANLRRKIDGSLGDI